MSLRAFPPNGYSQRDRTLRLGSGTSLREPQGSPALLAIFPVLGNASDFQRDRTLRLGSGTSLREPQGSPTLLEIFPVLGNARDFQRDRKGEALSNLLAVLGKAENGGARRKYKRNDDNRT